MIHIVLPVHNRAQVTARFLQALAQQSSSDYRLVLVDDGCTDDTVERARQALPAQRLVVLRGDGNLWWAGALQLAYEHMCDQPFDNDDVVLICNDDVTFGPTFLASAVTVLNEHPRAAVQAVGNDVATGSVDRGAIADLVLLRFRGAAPGQSPNCLSTRCLAMRMPVFLDSGGFHPDRLPHYLSDYEFTLRLRRQGVTLLCDPRFEAKVHLELTGQGRYTRRSLHAFWSTTFSNRAKYNPKHWTAFVTMVCPPWTIPFHLARIWLRFAVALVLAGIPAGRVRE